MLTSPLSPWNSATQLWLSGPGSLCTDGGPVSTSNAILMVAYRHVFQVSSHLCGPNEGALVTQKISLARRYSRSEWTPAALTDVADSTTPAKLSRNKDKEIISRLHGVQCTRLLVDAKAKGCLCDVEHDAGAAVVVLEGHTLVDGRVALDVDIVSPLRDGNKQQPEIIGTITEKVWLSQLYYIGHSDFHWEHSADATLYLYVYAHVLFREPPPSNLCHVSVVLGRQRCIHK